jgi:hypothetical protein
MKTPTKPGLYRVACATSRWKNGIAEIYGDAPFLRVRLWIPGENKCEELKSTYPITEWGPRLVERNAASK